MSQNLKETLLNVQEVTDEDLGKSKSLTPDHNGGEKNNQHRNSIAKDIVEAIAEISTHWIENRFDHLIALKQHETE